MSDTAAREDVPAATAIPAGGGTGHTVEEIEISLLLEGIYRQWGYDFRDYARASLKRRLWKRVRAEKLDSISALQERVLRDSSCMDRLLRDLSINVTAMFRDPAFYKSLRENVVPKLRTYPFTRIWVAGCSTGQEVYSLAILLHEEGLLDRTRIYGTDMNAHVLEVARKGVYPLDEIEQDQQNYLEAGGTGALSDYYAAGYDGAILRRALAENVVFAQHNLAVDQSFNEFHLIVCRNVMIYFDKPLQERVHRLFYESLTRFGFFILGPKENIRFTPHDDCYKEIDAEQRIYQRKS